jgi:hypothetical protein
MISSIAWELDNKKGTFGLKVSRLGKRPRDFLLLLLIEVLHITSGIAFKQVFIDIVSSTFVIALLPPANLS